MSSISYYGKTVELVDHRLEFNAEAVDEKSTSSHNHYKVSGVASRVFIGDEEHPAIVSIPLEKNIAEALRLEVKGSPTRSLDDHVVNKQFGFMVGGGRAMPKEIGKLPIRPEPERLLWDLATDVDELYQALAFHAYEKQSVIANVHSAFRISDTVFTNGVVNVEPSIRYHYDVGNFEGAMTAVVVYAKETVGSGLCFPQLNYAVVSDEHAMLVLFEGGRLLHAPTPYKIKKGGYRLSIVYYALKNMLEVKPT